MAFELPRLSYALNELAPVMSEETLQYHYGKHHQTYITNLNNMIQGTPFEKMSLEEIVLASDGVNAGIYNNAAQTWNHTFFWMCLTTKSTGKPAGGLLAEIEETWGSFEAFREKFLASAAANFGSGWTWLVMTPAKTLEIVNTSNAGCQLASDNTPLMVVDVWEHAYYIDYRNRRPDYLRMLFDRLIDWEFVAKNYYNAK
ncbi:MAG: superoxide dismutase [Candidatus Aphodousia sp.]|nr:superoxide dismutase [Sutterella sp.]MDY2899440.1 superoxide dismutase [Candidatus Aphodousia sp.]